MDGTPERIERLSILLAFKPGTREKHAADIALMKGESPITELSLDILYYECVPQLQACIRLLESGDVADFVTTRDGDVKSSIEELNFGTCMLQNLFDRIGGLLQTVMKEESA